ncbi:hypothetical protein T4B_12763 [Trichinella pseudospiralis]|uniref:Uncharacterized protein n=1 Tax=Trichinella pseudospiralis TaxID=6337 RepID=A0A0V1GL34_TRIPS|nr:hypothetical protein T4B_12763 [Trichinella pseudospiralis]
MDHNRFLNYHLKLLIQTKPEIKNDSQDKTLPPQTNS